MGPHEVHLLDTRPKASLEREPQCTGAKTHPLQLQDFVKHMTPYGLTSNLLPSERVVEKQFVLEWWLVHEKKR